jgi:hypothetical protein
MLDKLKFYDGTCFPVVSDAWGCCLTSCGVSWADRVNCCGGDIKGLYAACLQIEALCLKPTFDKTHPEVKCVLLQGYAYLVQPEFKLCKGSQQFLCVQNRVACPCDDEVPSTCTICGFQKCRNQRGTVHKLELIPFLPFPQVRVEEQMERIQGGHDEKLHVPWYAACCNDAATATHADFRQLFACYGANITGGWDFPACCGANIVGTLACCLGIDFVFLKPVDEHRRVRYMLIQGHGYVQDPKDRICKGRAQVFCLETRYAYPADADVPCALACCGVQCFKEWQPECELGVKKPPLPRVKPRVSEASDVLYHETMKRERGKSFADAPAAAPGTEEMVRA